ncbi:MAG TPA: HAD-IIIC family phosphatase [Bryobacteraceae bacterium]|nr:HAD-IIIC family phosphatase [Bryobacteraceae bacterium]
MPSSAPQPSQLTISATFTAEPLAEILGFWLSELGLGYGVQFAPYNQVFQQLLDPGSLLSANSRGINALLVRIEDWKRFGRPQAAELEETAQRLVESVRAFTVRCAAPLIVCLCPSPGGFSEIESVLRSKLQGTAGVHLLAAEEIARLYPVDEVHDPHADELGHVPYTPEYFAALGTALARKVHALTAEPYKVIVLDCDETLWSGICGEDGPEGIVLDAPRRALQEFMLRQRQAGMLLALSSKNNEEDVLETFRRNPEMPLHLEHFVSWRINWQPKSAGLRSLAEELGLGLDSFIFVDDLPKECAEVEAQCPEVLTLALPPDPAEIPEFLAHVWAFDHATVTEEDRRRAAMYAEQAQRDKLARQAASLADFIASLDLQVRIATPVAAQLPRVAQLTQRTNQMNATTRRRTEGEIRALMDSGEAELLAVEVSDRFGSYGLTGVAIFRTREEALEVDTFLLSCRVLGRGVEHRLLARLGQIAAERGLPWVDVPFQATARNRPALHFLESAGAAYRQERDGGVLFRFRTADVAALEYRPDQEAPAPAPPEPRPQSRRAVSRPDYVKIARELRDPRVVLERARAAARSTVVRSGGGEPRTVLEAELARMWEELLGVRPGIRDSFFDLGGHSLMAVELLARVRRRYGVDLSLEVVYGGPFTIEELAKAVELAQIAGAGEEEYAALLAELEQLTDEEARALLEREAREQGSH